MTYVKFNVPHTKMDSAKVERLKKAFEDLKAIRAEIEADYLASPEGLGVQAMAQPEYNRKVVNLNWGVDNNLTASAKVTEDYDAKRVFGPSPLQIGEKTINALLTGKLLTDDQKRALIKRLGVDIDTLVEGGAA